MSVITITKENFERNVLKSDKPVLVDFWAGWCLPCRMFAPTLEKIADSENYIKVGKINVDEQRELAQQFQVMGIPTLLLFENGQVINRSSGLMRKGQVKKFIEIVK